MLPGLFPGIAVIMMCCKILMSNETMSVVKLVRLFLQIHKTPGIQ